MHHRPALGALPVEDALAFVPEPQEVHERELPHDRLGGVHPPEQVLDLVRRLALPARQTRQLQELVPAKGVEVRVLSSALRQGKDLRRIVPLPFIMRR